MQEMELTRGDSLPLKFQRLDDDGNVITVRPSALYFTVKKTFDHTTFILQKSIDDMTFGEDEFYHLVIDPSETAAIPYGDYVFDVEVTTEGYVWTIAKGILHITQEATWTVNK